MSVHTFLSPVCFHVSVWEVVSCSSRVFSEASLVFSGLPPLFMMFSCVFAVSRTVCALFVVLWVSSGHFPVGFFCFFVCLGPICWSLGGLLSSFLWIRKDKYVCQLAPPDHQLGGKWGHQVDFCPSPGVDFRTTFCYFFVFFGMLRFCGN